MPEPASPFILLHPSDNVLVCRAPVEAGDRAVIDEEVIVIAQSIEVGHKVARTALAAGDKVLKYGAPIGSMTRSAHKGGHVHLHNMRSDYIGSHTRKAVD